MYLLKDDAVFPKEKFISMKFQPYEIKPAFSMRRIYQWYHYWNGKVYVSLSGGLDSAVLAYIVCLAYEGYHLSGTIYLVHSNTGMEFPEIEQFVYELTEWLQWRFPTLDIELVIIGPEHNFKWVCENKGFPIGTKEVAAKIRKLRHGNLSDRYRNYLLNGDERGKFGMLPKKWQYLADVNETKEDISEVCCEILKKKPFRQYEKETGRYPFIGITQDESFVRENKYNHTGCNVYDGKTIKSQPIGFWRKQEVIQYTVEQGIPMCSVYGEAMQNDSGFWILTGEQRTGCVLCGFGCHLESQPNRIQRLCMSDCKSHRAMYDWGMKIENHGVTYKAALEHCGIPTGMVPMQINLFDFMEV